MPVLRLGEEVRADYEVSGYGSGKTTIDWVLSRGDVSIALEVKCRTIDLRASMQKIDSGARSADGTAPAPAHDVAQLLRSVESKFSPRKSSEVIQGAWIHTEIKQEETELSTAFANLDATRVHVLILGDWDQDAYVIARDPVSELRAVSLLGLRQSRRFVFQRNAETGGE